MRKIILTVVAACALVAFIPASSLAHGHKRHHRAHHSRVHHKTFGHDWSQSGSNTTPSTSSDQNAGTVQLFMNGVLTIALNDGSTVIGNVTSDTEIECQAAEPAGMQSHDRGNGDNGGGDNGDNNDQGDDDQGQGDDEHNHAQNCDTSALTLGAVVHEARLKLSGAGATWDKVELVTSSSSSDNDD